MNASMNNGGGNIGDEDDNGRRENFAGLKSADHLKKVCNMFRNNDFKS